MITEKEKLDYLLKYMKIISEGPIWVSADYVKTKTAIVNEINKMFELKVEEGAQ